MCGLDTILESRVVQGEGAVREQVFRSRGRVAPLESKPSIAGWIAMRLGLERSFAFTCTPFQPTERAPGPPAGMAFKIRRGVEDLTGEGGGE